MQSIIELLKQQNNKLLQSEGAGIELFRGLEHNKKGLDLLLSNAIVEVILSSSKERLLCSSNEELVKRFSAAKAVGTRLPRAKQSPFKTSPRHSALTWDLLKNKPASIAGKRWEIVNFIPIKTSNIDVLQQAILDLLKKVL